MVFFLACHLHTERFKKLEQTGCRTNSDNLDIIRKIPTESLPICIAACASDFECYMFVWNKADSFCNLLRERSKYNMIIKTDSSVYYKLNDQYLRKVDDVIKKGIISYTFKCDFPILLK